MNAIAIADFTASASPYFLLRVLFRIGDDSLKSFFLVYAATSATVGSGKKDIKFFDD
jgi:hypothetical protein